MIARTAARAACIALVAIVLFDAAAHAQRGQPPGPRGQRFQPRVYLSGWGGGFTSFGGFAEGEDEAFFNFDGSVSYGGGLHLRVGDGLVVGIDGAYASTEYQRHQRQTGAIEDRGDARVATGLVSARLMTGGGGGLGLYLAVGAGVFAYDLQDQEPVAVESWDKDFALNAGVGLDYRLAPRLGLFFEWSQFWAYHQKEAGISRNTAKHNLLKLGGRVGI